jgi:hypothetical protein
MRSHAAPISQKPIFHSRPESLKTDLVKWKFESKESWFGDKRIKRGLLSIIFGTGTIGRFVHKTWIVRVPNGMWV